ncbi:MAG: hypothetical protein NWF06_09700 [Candidatus Bathyarchaeota archaeon]|nr:hypothetical protein [Candidatus Bathyarchaeum sp.]
MVSSGYGIRDTLVLLTVSVGVLLIVLFIASNQAVYAVLVFAGLTIPLALLAFEYKRNFREFQCKNCNHWFSVSYLRLLFTRKFRGSDPVPSEAVAYDLKCPNCNKKDWLTPSG